MIGTTRSVSRFSPTLTKQRPGMAGYLSLDIIGDSVYLVYAKLQKVARQPPRFSGGDRLDAGRVSETLAGLSDCLRNTLSPGVDVPRHSTAAPCRRRCQRRVAEL